MPESSPFPPQLLGAIIESAPTALVMIDRQGMVVLVNAEVERLFGHARAELFGKPIEVLVPARFRGLHPAFRTGYFVEPKARRMGAGRDLFGLRRDGSEFPVEIGLNPIRAGDQTYTLSAIVDISERKRMEARFRATIESAPTAMVMIDRRGNIVLVNSETEKLFGYARDEMLGKPIEILIPDRYRSPHPHLREDFFSRPQARRMGAGRDLRGLRRDGSEIPIEIGLNPVETEEGTYVLSSIVDISERIQAADLQRRVNEELDQRVRERTAALERSNEALGRSNEELQQFAYVASHDLQTPLRGIAGYAQLLERDFGEVLGPEGRDLVKRLVGSTTHLQSMIKDLLAYSRVDSHERPFTDVPLEAVWEDALALLSSPIGESNAVITHDPLPRVRGDRTQLVQLFCNLIGNAVKYQGPRVSRVHASAEVIGGECRVSIRDNGIGIAAEFHDKIFEIFKRLHTQQAYPGTGIGLAICRRVVNRHGGRIWVESEPGRGSTFHFILHLASLP